MVRRLDLAFGPGDRRLAVLALGESSTWQATLGKRIMGVYVADEHGNQISFVRALVRWVCKIFSGLFFCIGYVMIMFTARR